MNAAETIGRRITIGAGDEVNRMPGNPKELKEVSLVV